MSADAGDTLEGHLANALAIVRLADGLGMELGHAQLAAVRLRCLQALHEVRMLEAAALGRSGSTTSNGG